MKSQISNLNGRRLEIGVLLDYSAKHGAETLSQLGTRRLFRFRSAAWVRSGISPGRAAFKERYAFHFLRIRNAPIISRPTMNEAIK